MRQILLAAALAISACSPALGQSDSSAMTRLDDYFNRVAPAGSQSNTVPANTPTSAPHDENGDVTQTAPATGAHFDAMSVEDVTAACAPYAKLGVDYENACSSFIAEGSHPHVPTRAEVNQWVKLMRKGRRTGNFDALYKLEGLDDFSRTYLNDHDAAERRCDTSPSCVRITITPE